MGQEGSEGKCEGRRMRGFKRVHRLAKADRQERLQRWNGWLVERLVTRLSIRMAQAGLHRVHVVASRHVASRHGSHRLGAMLDAQRRAGVRRDSKLHEQDAEQRDKRSDQAG